MISPLVAGGNLLVKGRAQVEANPRHSRAEPAPAKAWGGNPVHPSGMDPRLRGGDIFSFSPHKGKRANPGYNGYFVTGSHRSRRWRLEKQKDLIFGEQRTEEFLKKRRKKKTNRKNEAE